jgi:TRAP transporter TAXI family solute receptor
MIRRRSVLAAGLGLFGLAGCTSSGYQGPSRELTIAAGESGGFYLAFAELLAAETTAAEPRLRCTALSTAGSVANAELLRSGGAQLGLMLADSAQAARRGVTPFTEPLPLLALGRVYENYLQLVVRADSSLHAIGDLAGRTVSLGAAGSGAALTGDRMLAAARLTQGRDLRVERRPLGHAVAGLENREVDALLWSGGVPTGCCPWTGCCPACVPSTARCTSRSPCPPGRTAWCARCRRSAWRT